MATATDDAENGVGLSDGGVSVVSIDASGSYQVGRFLGFRDEDPRDVGNRTFRNCSIGLLVVGAVVAVQYQSRDSAERVVNGAQRGDLVAVPAELKHGIGRDNRPYGFWVEPSGRAVDAAEFGL